MYKLVVIAGKLRGEEFTLEDGESILGRDPSTQVPIPVGGVSKQHLKLTVRGNHLFIEDLGSSNGTFVNGKLTKSQELKPNDKIAIPDTIIQVVYIKEKKVIVEKESAANDDDEDDTETDYMAGADNVPDHPVGKIVHAFKYKIMAYVHGFNEEYEWRVMFAVFLSIFVFITVGLIVSPILQSSKKLLIKEVAKRGAHYADEISRLNSRELAKKQLGQLNTGFLKKEDGVLSYELFDLEGHIYAPQDKQGEVIKDTFSIEAREKLMKVFSKKGKSSIKKFLYDQGEMQIGIAQLMFSYNAKIGDQEPVGIIALRFQPTSLIAEAANNSQAFLEALSMAAIVAVLFFGIIYYLTVRPIDEIRFQIEDVLRGRQKQIEPRLMMAEIGPLKNTINALLLKVRELTSDGGDSEFNEMEEDGEYVRILGDFIDGAGCPAMVLNSEKLVQRINLEAEDVVGLREESTVGSSLMETAREQGFAATVTDLCDQSANAEGACQKDSYELSGVNYEINVVSLMGKDGFAKAFYITFSRDS